MKRLALSLLLLTATTLRAQTFDSGSNGSYGPIDITVNTVLDVPPDGMFHCTTITVGASAVLSFNRNALNTPVYLLATGDVTILGSVFVNAQPPAIPNTGGRGGPGGFDGGASGFISSLPGQPGGDGQGPGGGRHGTGATVGSGGFRTINLSEPGTRGHGGTYGNALLMPLLGGSGGGGLDGVDGGHGGGGGGAILIASNTKIVHRGSIQAIGGSGGGVGATFFQHDGSGGAIRLVAPGVYGTGSMTVNGSGPPNSASGRIRFDALLKTNPQDPTETLAIQTQPAGALSIGANMTVFPPGNPRLDVIEAAGTAIPEGTTAPVAVVLPAGSPAAQTIVVQARDFGGSVPIRVALVPESGDSSTYDATIDNTTTNPATATVNVTMPATVKVNIQVWTRPE